MPYAAGYDKTTFRGDDYALGRVPRIASHRGFLFASMSPTGPSLADRLGRAAALLDQFVDLAPRREIIVKGGVLRHVYKGNWKMALENSVDGYHPNILHHPGLMLMTKNRGVSMEELFGERADARARDLGGGCAQLNFSVVNRKHDGRGVPPAWSPQTQREYSESMTRVWGAERAKEIIENGPPHFCIFPNLIFILNQIRVIEPIAVDETVVSYYPTLLEGAPEEMNRRRLSETYLIHGPAGYVAPDDFEAYERNRTGLEARANEWLVLRRGLHREELEPSGTLAGHEADETTQRGLWRHYREVMVAQ